MISTNDKDTIWLQASQLGTNDKSIIAMLLECCRPLWYRLFIQALTNETSHQSLIQLWVLLKWKCRSQPFTMPFQYWQKFWPEVMSNSNNIQYKWPISCWYHFERSITDALKFMRNHRLWHHDQLESNTTCWCSFKIPCASCWMCIMKNNCSFFWKC